MCNNCKYSKPNKKAPCTELNNSAQSALNRSKNRTIDWQKKESARAGMRRMVKKLLKRYKYPPEGMDDAIAIVIKQCEVWVES